MTNAASSSAPVTRTQLLTAVIDGPKPVERVEIRRVDMAPNLPSGPHLLPRGLPLHPCPVVGVILQGSIRFQVEGEAERILHAGDAFYEPANIRIPHFDALEQGASFAAHYLLGPGETETIKMLG